MSPASVASFWGLCLVQGAVVLAPGVVTPRPLGWLRARWPVVVLPVAAVVAATFLPAVSEALAGELSTLALVAVPPLAALGAGWLCRFAAPRLVLLVPVALAVAWAFSENAVGTSAALLLVVTAAAALAALVVALVPTVVAEAGIVLWAAFDLSTALTNDLERASHAITRATPAVAPQLQLQRIELGTASMEFADLFVAAMLGAVLAAQGWGRTRAAILVAVLAMSLAPFFLVVDVVPGTVPVALALGVEELRRRRQLSPPRSR